MYRIRTPADACLVPSHLPFSTCYHARGNSLSMIRTYHFQRITNCIHPLETAAQLYCRRGSPRATTVDCGGGDDNGIEGGSPVKRRSGMRISEDETGATWGDTGSGTMDPVGSVVVGRWGDARGWRTHERGGEQRKTRMRRGGTRALGRWTC